MREAITFGAVLLPLVIRYIALTKYVRNIIPKAPLPMIMICERVD